MTARSARSIAAIGLLVAQAPALAGCVFLADVGRTSDSHIVDGNGTGFNVTMEADGKTLHVDLDTEQAVEKRLLWAATFGVNQGPLGGDFDAVGSKWLNFQHPECKIGKGRRVSLGSSAYDLSCPSAAPPK